jgi:hypothetical protein
MTRRLRIPCIHGLAPSVAMEFPGPQRLGACAPSNPATRPERHEKAAGPVWRAARVCTLPLRRHPPTAAQNRRVGRRGDAVASSTRGKQGRNDGGRPHHFQEVPLQRRVKWAGGRWNPVRRLWELRRDQALKLGLKDRIEQAKVSIRRNC